MTNKHVIFLSLLLLLPACTDELAKSSTHVTRDHAAAVAGAWKIPASTLAIGDSQYVSYDGAGAWNNGANCTGGLTAGGSALRNYLLANFPQISGIGGYACRRNTASTNKMSVHGTGRALDIFIPLDGGEADNGLGDPVGNWLIENAEEIGIQYIIWDRWTWGAHRPSGSKDRSYGGPHPHHDHLHVEISIEAGNRQTDFFQGPMTPPEPTPPPTPTECEPGAAYDPQFCDDDGHWAENAINYIFDNKITVGCGTINDKPKFCPEDIANRAQTIVMIARASKMPTSGHPQTFTDMAGFEWAAPAANAALAYNITSGCGGTGTTFCPGDPTQRSHVAVFLVNTYALPPATQDYFDDDEGSIFENAHNRFAEAGITRGCGTRKFCGGEDVTRAELAVFLSRVHKLGLRPHWEPEPPAPTSEDDPVDPETPPEEDTSPPAEDTAPSGEDTQPAPDAGEDTTVASPEDTGAPTLGDATLTLDTAQDDSHEDTGFVPGPEAPSESACGCTLFSSPTHRDPHALLWGLLVGGLLLVARRERS